jgi:hypothetical protein
MMDRPELFFTLFSGMTGLTLDDVLNEVTAETEEERTKASMDNTEKMCDHIHGETYRGNDE